MNVFLKDALLGSRSIRVEIVANSLPIIEILPMQTTTYNPGKRIKIGAKVTTHENSQIYWTCVQEQGKNYPHTMEFNPF